MVALLPVLAARTTWMWCCAAKEAAARASWASWELPPRTGEQHSHNHTHPQCAWCLAHNVCVRTLMCHDLHPCMHMTACASVHAHTHICYAPISTSTHFFILFRIQPPTLRAYHTHMNASTHTQTTRSLIQHDVSMLSSHLAHTNTQTQPSQSQMSNM